MISKSFPPRFLVLFFTFLSCASFGAITVDHIDNNGTLEVSWTDGVLAEVSSEGKVIEIFERSPVRISKPEGTYYFEERYCTEIPFEGFSCLITDTNLQHLRSNPIARATSTKQYPESAGEQYSYTYQIRSGDLNGDGSTELYVERLTLGPADGSMPSYVIWPLPKSYDPRSPFRNYVVTALPRKYEAVARQAAIAVDGQVQLTDGNLDGYPDHLITGFDDMLGEDFNSMALIYAPGTNSNKSVPHAAPHLTKEWARTYQELTRWLNDVDYIFNQTLRRRVEPELYINFKCETVAVSRRDGMKFVLDNRIVCYLFFPSSVRTEYRIGVTPHTERIASALDRVLELGSSIENVWRLSNALKPLIGTHICGFSSTGDRIDGNVPGVGDERAFSCFAMAARQIIESIIDD